MRCKRSKTLLRLPAPGLPQSQSPPSTLPGVIEAKQDLSAFNLRLGAGRYRFTTAAALPEAAAHARKGISLCLSRSRAFRTL